LSTDKDIPLSWDRLSDKGAAQSTAAPIRVTPITLIFFMCILLQVTIFMGVLLGA
jgi:hypothetical protein